MVSQLPLPLTLRTHLSSGNGIQEKKKPCGFPVTISLKELEVAPTCRKGRLLGGPGRCASGDHLSNAPSLRVGQELDSLKKMLWRYSQVSLWLYQHRQGNYKTPILSDSMCNWQSERLRRSTRVIWEPIRSLREKGHPEVLKEKVVLPMLARWGGKGSGTVVVTFR